MPLENMLPNIQNNSDISKTASNNDISKINTNSAINKLKKSNLIYDRHEIEWYEKFNRWGCLDPYNKLQGAREYIFFAKPDLHIFESDGKLNPELIKSTIFQDAYERYTEVLKQLQLSTPSCISPFCNLLTNSVRSSLDLPNVSAETIETSANIYGHKITYRQLDDASDSNCSFSLDFEDTKYLEIYMFFKLYSEYEKLKFYGEISPPDKNYIIYKIIHDQMAVYKIVVEDDGETILYYAKYWGVYPTTVPRDSFSEINTELKYSVSFNASFVEDMDPMILADFNNTVFSVYKKENLMKYTKVMKTYDSDTGTINGDWALMPYIIKTKSDISPLKKVYKLKWRAHNYD